MHDMAGARAARAMPRASVSPRNRQVLWWLVVAGVPCAIVAWAAGTFVWNHFIDGPFLHDSGWYSAIVWRRGAVPANPPAAHPIPSFFGIHVSFAVSIASLLSYLSPVGRVGWFCAFQAVIYAPLGAVVALLDGDLRASRSGRDIGRVGLVSLVFTLNGEVLSCLGYPHFEILIPAALCIMLAALATGRTTLAWFAMACALGTREDGGLHAALFLSAVLVSDWTGRPFVAPRATVLKMAFVAFFFSVGCFAFQKAFFVTANLFHEEYLGTPIYGHVTGPEMLLRARGFFERVGFLWAPMLVTVAIAVRARDPRYLLGWVVELPWLLLNFFAAQHDKAMFFVYAGFPFVTSLFWVGAYARVRSAGADRGSWLGPLLALSLACTVGFVFAVPFAPSYLRRTAVWPRQIPEGLAVFSDTVRNDARAYGRLRWESDVASWAIETLPNEDLAWRAEWIQTFEERDGVVFYLRGDWWVAGELFPLLARSPFSDCRRALGSDVFLCVRPGREGLRGFVPSSPLLASMRTGVGAARIGEEIEVEAREPILSIWGPTITLPAGQWESTWQVRWGACKEGAGAAAAIDAYAERPLARADVDASSETLTLSFDTSKRVQNAELRLFTGRCALTVQSAWLRRIPDGRPPAPR